MVFVLLMAELTAAGGNAAGLASTSGREGGRTYSAQARAGSSSMTSMIPAVSPMGRAWSVSAYDPVDRYVVLFGGGNNTTLFNDTWTYAGGNWTLIHPARSPPSNSCCNSMVWDARDSYILLFMDLPNRSGGRETWTFLAGNWTQLHPSVSPPLGLPSDGGQMAYDAKDGYVVLVVGIQSSNGGVTWAFSGGVWKLKVGIRQPGPGYLFGASMAYDPVDGYVVLFGGEGSQVPIGSTWTYATGKWTLLHSGLWAQKHPAKSPSARVNAVMTYDTTTHRLLLYGGYICCRAYAFANDTWSFVRGNWSKVGGNGNSAPPGRVLEAFSYDALDRYPVLFGGQSAPPLGSSWPIYLSDTWAFIRGAWVQV